MENAFFTAPILNSPYEYPARHWELDEKGQPTQRIIESRRDTRYISPIPRPRKQKTKSGQKALGFGEGRAFPATDLSRPFDKPKSGRVAVKVINHLGDELMKVFRV